MLLYVQQLEQTKECFEIPFSLSKWYTDIFLKTDYLNMKIINFAKIPWRNDGWFLEDLFLQKIDLASLWHSINHAFVQLIQSTKAVSIHNKNIWMKSEKVKYDTSVVGTE